MLCASIPGGSVASLAIDSKEAGKKDGASQMSIDVKSLEQQLSVDNVGTGSGADGTVSPRSQLGSASSELAKSYGFRPLSTCASASVKPESDGFTILKSAWIVPILKLAPTVTILILALTVSILKSALAVSILKLAL